MRESEVNETYEDIYETFESFFALLKTIRDLENRIPELRLKEGKIKAYKDYFKNLEKLKEVEVVIEEYLPALF